MADIHTLLARIGAVVAPYARVDMVVREQPIGVTHEQLEQLILPPCQIHKSSVDEHAVVGGVELQLCELQLDLGELRCVWLPIQTRTPDQTTQSRLQLSQIERLRHVVIRTGVKPGDAVANGRVDREHQYRHARLKKAETAAHG